MKVSKSWLKRPVSFCLIAILGAPLCGAETPLPSAPQPAGIAAAAAESGAKPSEGIQQSPPGPQAQQQTQQESSSQIQGTAAGPAIKPEGVPASRPAGAAIAPARQRRIRVIALRWGLIIGAAVAVGTVAAASLGSPARP